MARSLNNDAYITIIRARHDAAKLLQRALACEASGMEHAASHYLSLSAKVEDKANHEQLRLAIS